VNKLALEANTALLARETAVVLGNKTATKAKLKTHSGTMTTTLANAATSLATKTDAVHRKLDRHATTLQQARAESTRVKTANMEQHLATKRSLFAHQTKMQNQLDELRHAANTAMATQAATLAAQLQINEFNINTVKTANGPRVKIADLKTESCTTDQFGKVTCTKSSATSSFTSNSAYDASTPR